MSFYMPLNSHNNDVFLRLYLSFKKFSKNIKRPHITKLPRVPKNSGQTLIEGQEIPPKRAPQITLCILLFLPKQTFHA